jgi:cobalt/nickel transport system permease protein
MHMANELLSVPVAAGSFAAAGLCLGYVCKQAKEKIGIEKFAMMGVMGAFVFAAQMINFPVPFLPGVSGHITGAVIVAILLGPLAGAIIMSSVVIIQCLVFQDGGLLAIGCNLLNIALVPSFLGYYIYTAIAGKNNNEKNVYIASVSACVISLTVSAMLIPIEAGLSGVLAIPAGTFIMAMAGIYFLVGIVEGLLTAGVVVYLGKMRPGVFGQDVSCCRKAKGSFYSVCIIGVIVIAAFGTKLASEKPDGLEWSSKEIVSNESKAVAMIETLQSKHAPLPDYEFSKTNMAGVVGNGWAGLSAVIGAGLTMGAIWLVGAASRKREA